MLGLAESSLSVVTEVLDSSSLLELSVSKSDDDGSEDEPDTLVMVVPELLMLLELAASPPGALSIAFMLFLKVLDFMDVVGPGSPSATAPSSSSKPWRLLSSGVEVSYDVILLLTFTNLACIALYTLDSALAFYASFI
jgi:hypothetical protein